MPELPELEVVKRILAPQLNGRVVVSAKASVSVVAHPNSEAFCRRVPDKRFAQVDRRGKFLIFTMSDGCRFIVHLRMTGRLSVAAHDRPEDRSTRAILELDDGSELRFSDARGFGRIWWLERGEEDLYSGTEKLGTDPFDPALTPESLEAKFDGRKITVKQALTEQKSLAGIGNAYADEICFAAGVRPDRRVREMSKKDWEKIFEQMRKVLADAIVRRMVAEDVYRDMEGDTHELPSVYGVHAKKKCPICRGALVTMAIGGRTAYFCPHCQK